jgi:hypothetical protein
VFLIGWLGIQPVAVVCNDVILINLCTTKQGCDALQLAMCAFVTVMAGDMLQVAQQPHGAVLGL